MDEPVAPKYCVDVLVVERGCVDVDWDGVCVADVDAGCVAAVVEVAVVAAGCRPPILQLQPPLH